ncbi:MAG: nucleotidyltransferase domain-containing protein [Candidatus Latescibacteria bacterium]|nr:nucleotidyltransferase domain-containing protein [Candidatus Latescibacterota bacterium]
MIPLVLENQAAIERLCEQHHVRRLELFGSALSEATFNKGSSDLDFLVDFLPLEPGRRADTYFGLREGLESLLGRPVDLVVRKAIKNPYFRQAIDPTCKLLYAA